MIFFLSTDLKGWNQPQPLHPKLIWKTVYSGQYSIFGLSKSNLKEGTSCASFNIFNRKCFSGWRSTEKMITLVLIQTDCLDTLKAVSLWFFPVYALIPQNVNINYASLIWTYSSGLIPAISSFDDYPFCVRTFFK